MTTFRILGLAAIASTAMAADERGGVTAPVLRSSEPSDSVVFRLPGPPPPPVREVPQHKLAVAAPVPIPSPLPTKLTLAPLPSLPTSATAAAETREREIAFFMQKQI